MYQGIDNHLLKDGKKIQECKACPAGHWAPKTKEFSDFQTWPEVLTKSCGLATPIGNVEDCEVYKGWFVNSGLNLDSSGERGIPRGLKFSMKAFLNITSQYGGRAIITYKMSDFTSDEYFRILINGVL